MKNRLIFILTSVLMTFLFGTGTVHSESFKEKGFKKKANIEISIGKYTSVEEVSFETNYVIPMTAMCSETFRLTPKQSLLYSGNYSACWYSRYKERSFSNKGSVTKFICRGQRSGFSI